jgi:hypothetical protein
MLEFPIPAEITCSIVQGGHCMRCKSPTEHFKVTRLDTNELVTAWFDCSNKKCVVQGYTLAFNYGYAEQGGQEYAKRNDTD